MAVFAGVPPVLSLSNFTPLELAPPARCGATPGRPDIAVVAGVPPVFSLSNVSPFELAPRLAPCGGLAVAQPRAGPSWPLLPAFPQVFSLSNFTPCELAPRLAPRGGLAVAPPRAGTSWPLLPAVPPFFLSPTSLPFSLPPAWPHVAGSTWRNLGPARHGRCCWRSPRFFSLERHSPSAVVAGIDPVFSLSNFTPRELAPRLAPCGGLAVAQPRANTSWP